MGLTIAAIRQIAQHVVRARALCACGSAVRVVEAIEGRCEDICAFIDANGTDANGTDANGTDANGTERVVYADIIRRSRMVLLASPDVTDYVAVQERLGHLCLHSEIAPGADPVRVVMSVRHSGQANDVQYGCRAEAIEVAQGLPAARPVAKRHRVQRFDERLV